MSLDQPGPLARARQIILDALQVAEDVMLESGAPFAVRVPCAALNATKSLWRVHPPMRIGFDPDGQTTAYVVASTTAVPRARQTILDDLLEWETYLFPSDAEGNWEANELYGSRKLCLSARQCFAVEGYTVLDVFADDEPLPALRLR